MKKISDIMQFIKIALSLLFFASMCILIIYKNTALLREMAVKTFTPDVVISQINHNFSVYEPYFEIINDIVIADFDKRDTTETVMYSIDYQRKALVITKNELIYLEPYQLEAIYKMNEYSNNEYKYSYMVVSKDRVMYSSASIAPYIVFVRDGKKPTYFFDENSKITFFSTYKAKKITGNWYMLYISAFL